MKLLAVAALVAASAASVGLRLAAAAEYSSWYYGSFATVDDLNATDICVGGLYNSSLLETNTSGTFYSAEGCSTADNMLYNISGMELPLLIVDVPVVPVGFGFRNGQVGAGSALVIQGPRSNDARMTMPWFVDISNNTFGSNAQLRVIGSIPINSTITISHNTFDITDGNALLPDASDRLMAISFGGVLTLPEEPMSIYTWAEITVSHNVIAIDATTIPKAGVAIALLSDQYFTDNTTLSISDNSINAQCSIMYECSGIDTASYFVMNEIYSNAKALIQRNDFTILNGKGFTVPLVFSPNASFYLKASENQITRTTGVGGASNAVSEHAITLTTAAIGFDSEIHVVDNVVNSIAGNALLFFVAGMDLTGNALYNLSANAVFTTGGDPSVYFVDMFSLIDRATFLINGNTLKRQDSTAVSRPYLSITYDFNVLGSALFSFSNNECYPQNIAAGPRMVFITDGRVANVGPLAYFAICGNVYNGNPADLIASQIMLNNVVRLINCNPRPELTLEPETTTTTSTAAPNTTTPTTTRNTNAAAGRATAVSAAVAAVLFGVIAIFA